MGKLKPHPDAPPHLLYQQKPQPLGTRQKACHSKGTQCCEEIKEKIERKMYWTLIVRGLLPLGRRRVLKKVPSLRLRDTVLVSD